MGCPQLFGQSQAVVVDIHGNDLMTAYDFRRHDRTQANSTGSKNGDGTAELGLQAVEYRTRAGLNTAAEWPQKSQVDALVHLDHVALMDHRVGGERGLPKKCRYTLIALTQTVRTIIHYAAEVQIIEGFARSEERRVGNGWRGR